MARYVVHVRSPLPPEEAFDFMADLRNFAEWDPGVIKATQVRGDGPGPDTAFDVVVNGVPKPLKLTYEVTSYERPTVVVAKAESSTLTSLDRITVAADDEAGSIVTYDAELTLNGVLGLFDPVLGLAFKRIGDKAAAGLITALDGQRVDTATV
ncbi:MAG: SRPBCC family protein [Actinomycetota bacterium]